MRRKREQRKWLLLAALFLTLFFAVFGHAETLEEEAPLVLTEEELLAQLEPTPSVKPASGQSAVFGIAVMNKQKDIELSWQGNYTSVVASGTYKNQKPSLVYASPANTAGVQVVEAWRVDNLKNNTALTLTARLEASPALGEGESLAFYTLQNGALSGAPVMEDVALGDLANIQLNFKGNDGIALVRVAADPGDLPLENNIVWANKDIYLTGKMPGNAVVDATPVTVEVDGEIVLAAYDVKIYTNEKQRQKGKTWQPSDQKVEVHFYGPAFRNGQEMNIYHLDDIGSAPQYVDTVVPVDNWITFEADSFSTYAVTVKEKIVEAGGETYKITVTYDAASGIPADAQVQAREISTNSEDYRAYLTRTAATLGVDVSSVVYTRLFDISLIGPDGTEYQPNDKVSVSIQLLEKEAQDVESVRVVHFAEEAAPAQPVRLNAKSLKGVASVQSTQSGAVAGGSELSATTNGATVTFNTQGFSVFALVDFTTKDKMAFASFGAQESQKLYQDDNITLSGALPPHGQVEAQAVPVQIDDTDVLIAYDIKIYANNAMKDAGINWQPSAGALTVQINSDVLEDGKTFSIYHMEDVNSEPVFVTTAEAVDHAVTFQADSFSIYPIGVDEENARIGYRFYYNDGTSNVLLSTQYFRYKDVHPKTGDALSISEPSIPGIEGATWTRIFKGWSKDAPTDDENKLLTNADLNDELQGFEQDAFVEGTYINLYANLKNVYYVTYLDVNPNNVLATEIVPKADSGDTTFTVRPENQLRPTIDTDVQFNGWYDMENGGEETLVPGRENVVIKKDLKLYPNIEGGHWLVFDDNDWVENENGDLVSGGASFTPPVFYLNAVTAAPTNPTRTGYQFDGWYTDTACSTPFTFGEMLTHDTTVYAKWTPSDSSYRVIIWKQQASDAVDAADADKKYDYVTSYLFEEDVKTAQKVILAEEYKNIYGINGTSEEVGKNYFVYNAALSDESTIIKADGSSVLNVYYDRKPITLNFYIYDYTYTQSTSNSNGYYYIPDGNGGYTREYLWRWNGNWYYNNTLYTGNRYTRSDRQSLQLYRSFTGLYGAEFTEWPSAGTGKTWTDGTYTYPLALTIFDPLSTYNGNNPNSFTETTIDFQTTDHTSSNNKLYIYVQTVDGEWSYTDEYVLSSADLGARGTWHPTETFTGFIIDSYQVGNSLNANGSWTPITTSGSISYNNQNIYLRYKRNTHTLTFYTNNGGNETASYTLRYGKPFAEYAEHNPGQRTGYYFLTPGWYADPSCTTPFDFTETMPDNNVAVYGKWKMERFRIVIVPGANNVYMGSQALRFRKDYDETLDGGLLTTAQRAGYNLAGWYTDPEFTHPFLFSTPVTDRTTDMDMTYRTAKWAAARAAYGDDDEAHENVRGILHLYARWTQDYTTSGINVIYDPGDAAIQNALGEMLTTVPIDTYLYPMADGIAVTREAPSNYSDLYTFKCWQATLTDGTTKTYNPSDNIRLDDLLASDTFMTEEGVLLRKTVTLTAVYELTGDTSRLTHITYEGNTFEDTSYSNGTFSPKTVQGKTKDGTDRVEVILDEEVNQNIELPSADDFYLDGWELVGWSFFAGTKEHQEEQAEINGELTFAPGQIVAADNLDKDEFNDHKNMLYAMWQEKTYTVTIKQVIEEGVPDSNFDYRYKRGVENVIESADEVVLHLVGNASNTLTDFSYYGRSGHAIRITPPTIPDTATYGMRVNAIVTRDDGTTEILNPTALGDYQILGNVTITYTYSPKVLVKLQKRDSINDTVLTGASFVVTPVEFDATTQQWINAGNGSIITVNEDTHEQYLQEGTYRIRENASPAGYTLINEDMFLTISKNEEVRFRLFNAAGDDLAGKPAGLDDTGRIMTVYNRPIRKVTLSKRVVGPDKKFEFKVTIFEIFEEDRTTRLGNYEVGVLAGETIRTNSIGEATLELGNNESVVLNIPHGCRLAVRETPDANYWPSYTWRENETFSEWGFASESNPVQITEDASLAYTNTVYVSPTGVSLRVAPYAVMLVMGLALMTALRYGKKRRMN